MIVLNYRRAGQALSIKVHERHLWKVLELCDRFFGPGQNGDGDGKAT